MKVSMIAAMANNRVIGKDNDMPWHLPADLAHFKRTTMGKPVVMGRKTFESIGRPLPGRANIVISRNADYEAEGIVLVETCEQAIAAAQQASPEAEEVMIMGGGTIYQHFLPIAQRLYLTEIDLSVDGDTFFPDYQSAAEWQVVDTESHQKDAKNPYDYTFITLDRV